MRVRSTPVFAALVVSVTVLVTAALSWDQELEADAESAERLHLHRSAIQLKEVGRRPLLEQTHQY